MQLFQINQSARSCKITINAYTTIGQLHQRSITSAAHYNRIYSTYLSLPDIHHPSGHVPELLRGSAAGQREGEVQLPGRGLAAADLPAAAGGGAAARAPAYCTLYTVLYTVQVPLPAHLRDHGKLHLGPYLWLALRGHYEFCHFDPDDNFLVMIQGRE